MSLVERKTWDEFRQAKLLWWINRILHTFGWAVVVEVSAEGKVTEAYPAKVGFRGFSEEAESEGFEEMHKFVDVEPPPPEPTK